MHGIQVGEKIVLNDDRKTDRGPIVKVTAVLKGGESGWYGVSVRQNRAWKNGDVFDCYLADFSDSKRKSKWNGWMEFVNPDDRKKWEDWKLTAAKKTKESSKDKEL